MNLPASNPPNVWTERYETLRQHFIENDQLLGYEPLGLSLLLENGMAGWMRAWQESGPPSALKPPAPNPQSSWSPPDAPVWKQELTHLIAHMTTSHLHPIQKL